MCLGIPMQVIDVDGAVAACRGRLGMQTVDATLVAPVAPGDWLLVSLGTARARLDASEAARIDRALDALDALERGETIDVAAYFADLVESGPTLPAALRSRP